MDNEFRGAWRHPRLINNGLIDHCLRTHIKPKAQCKFLTSENHLERVALYVLQGGTTSPSCSKAFSISTAPSSTRLSKVSSGAMRDWGSMSVILLYIGSWTPRMKCDWKLGSIRISSTSSSHTLANCLLRRTTKNEFLNLYIDCPFG